MGVKAPKNSCLMEKVKNSLSVFQIFQDRKSYSPFPDIAALELGLGQLAIVVKVSDWSVCNCSKGMAWDKLKNYHSACSRWTWKDFLKDVSSLWWRICNCAEANSERGMESTKGQQNLGTYDGRTEKRTHLWECERSVYRLSQDRKIMYDCDILAWERGPSLSLIGLVKTWKHHIRFIERGTNQSTQADGHACGHGRRRLKESPKDYHFPQSSIMKAYVGYFFQKSSISRRAKFLLIKLLRSIFQIAITLPRAHLSFDLVHFRRIVEMGLREPSPLLKILDISGGLSPPSKNLSFFHILHDKTWLQKEYSQS